MLFTYEDKLKEVENKLKDHLSQFDITNSKIALKYSHTFRTRQVSDIIAKELGLEDRDLYLSSIIALFHDYGRFDQIINYNTYNDSISLDHADYGAKLLIEDNQIQNFVEDLTDKEKQLIKIAIEDHNKYSIRSDLTEKQAMFCKIIRDADKIDIFKIASTGNIAMNNNLLPLKEEDMVCFNNRVLNKYAKNETFYTSVFNKLCYIFDINYKKTYQIIYQNNYIRDYKYFILLWSDFKIDERLLDCFDEAIDYIRERAED
ncbi:MAG: HD domain-containing protein [Clostridia bacterium]|nr:HD domain-containing protein [Clostridia bacterium]